MSMLPKPFLPNIRSLQCESLDPTDISNQLTRVHRPTFIFFKGSKQVDMIRGADRAYDDHLPPVLYILTGFFYSALDRTLRNLAGSPGQAAAEPSFPGRGNRLGGDGPAGTPPPNVQPTGGDAGGLKGFIYRVADMYHGLDPQLKVLCWVLFLYVAIQTFF